MSDDLLERRRQEATAAFRHALAHAQSVRENPSKLVRFTIGTLLIAMIRSAGCGPDEEAKLLVAAGYRNVNEYWSDALSAPMKVQAFAHLLDTHLLDPAEQLNDLVAG
jgi:hypothetical protein